MLAVIQDLVSVQVISSCAVKLSCWPDSFILSYQGDGELLLLFEKGKEHRPFQPGGVIYLSRGKAVYYRPAVIAVRHCRGDPAKRPCQGGSHVACLHFKTSLVSVY